MVTFAPGYDDNDGSGWDFMALPSLVRTSFITSDANNNDDDDDDEISAPAPILDT